MKISEIKQGRLPFLFFFVTVFRIAGTGRSAPGFHTVCRIFCSRNGVGRVAGLIFCCIGGGAVSHLVCCAVR